MVDNYSFEYYHELVAPYFNTMRSNTPELFEWEDFKERHTLFRAFENGQLAGFIFANITNRRVYFTNVTTVPAFRRRGVSRAIHAQIKSSYQEKGPNFIYCWIYDDNPASIALHTGIGLVRDSQYHIFCTNF
jgi:predicted GNAT superfamily acetyltransferase